MTPDSNSPERIMQFAWGFAPPLTIEVAIRNRVFDFLDTTPHTVQEVAEYAKGSTRGLASGVKLFGRPRPFWLKRVCGTGRRRRVQCIWLRRSQALWRTGSV
jgi:anti-sigma factor RsiW